MRSVILITGGSGLLALNWALEIRDRYSVILGLHERDISLAGVESQRIELNSVDHITRSFEEVQPQIVIHAAGLTSVEDCEAKPDLARHINIELAVNVANTCNKLGLPFVHISTDHLFAGDVSFIEENSPVAPRNVYGRTKAEAEFQVLAAHPQALVIRTNFYGWGPGYRRSFSDVIIDGLRSGKELTLFQDVFYTPILVETLVGAVHGLIDLKASGIYHVVGDERITKYEFGLKIAKEFGLDPCVIKPGFLADQTWLVQRPHEMSLSNKKTCNLLGTKLGDVGSGIARLRRQEQEGFTREIRKL